MISTSSATLTLTTAAIFMLTLSYANGFATLPTELDRSQQRCQLERTYKMVGYNCANLNLKEIPQTLKSSLEVSGVVVEARYRTNPFPMLESIR